MLHTFARWVVKNRVLVLLLSVVITMGFVSQIKNLKIIIDPNTMLPQQHPYVVGTNMAERIFGQNYVLEVLVSPKTGDIYQAEVLERIKIISDELLKLPGVHKETLMSLAAPRAKAINGTSEGMEVHPLMEKVPASPAEMEKLRTAILRNPIYQNSIVAADGRAAAITVTVEKGAKGFRPTIESVYELTNKLKTENIQIAVSGSPMYVSWVEKYAQRMVLLFPLALLIVGLLLLEAFRSWQGFFLPLLTAIVSVLWGVGLMGIAKVPFDAFNATTPILILAVAAGHAVQLLKRYYEEFDRLATGGLDPYEANRQAVIASIERVGPVMLVAGGVAVVAFLSLVTFDIGTIKSFGVFTGLGILSGLVIELTFIPALRACLKPPRIGITLDKRASIWQGVIEHISTMALHHRKLVYSFAILGAIAMGFGAKALNLENSNKSFFASDLPFQQDDRLINERMGGANTLYVVFEGQENDAIKNPEVLRLIDSTQRFIEQQPDVGKAVSIADLVKRMNQATSGDAQSAYTLPKDRNLISQYLLLYSLSGSPGDFDLYVDYNYRHASITAFLKNDSSLYIHDLIKRVEGFVDQHKVPGVQIHFGGSVPQSSALADELVSGKLRNVVQIGVVVTVVAALVFRSILAGLLVIAPLVVTVLVNFGVMGMTGIPLNTPNAISSVMAIGIGADYAIYLLYRIMEEYTVYGDLTSAVASAMKSAGKATLFVGSAIAGGYSVLMFSHGFYIHIWFGILIVLSMLVSMLTSLYLVPSLVLTMAPKFILEPNRNSSRIITSAASVLLFSSIFVCASQDVQASTMQPAEIMQKNYAVSKFNDSLAEATFKLVHKSGETRIRKTFGATKLESNGIDTMRMTRFVSPPDIRNTVTVLKEHSDRDDDIWVYLPALKKVRRLAAANKRDSFFGTDLSYGDVIGHKVEDWDHRLVSETSENGNLKYLIESTPKSPEISEQSGYSRRVLIISANSFLADRIDFYDVEGQLLKTAFFLEPKEIDARGHHWQAMRVEVQNHQTGHKTEILMDHFSANQGVAENYFTTRYMEKEN